MKVLLINPPYTRLRGSGQSAFFPLGLGYLAGALAGEGFEPLIYSAENCLPGEALPKVDMLNVFKLRSQGHKNYQAALADDGHYVWQELREVLAQEKPDLVGISALSIQFGAAARTAALVKAWNPTCPVVLGGHHVTYMPKQSLNQIPEFDVAVLGEGELTFLELCQAYAKSGKVDFSRIPGLAYRGLAGVEFSERRALCEDLDSLPFPRRDLVAHPEGFAPFHFSSLIYGRGCPWSCEFCSSQVFWQRRTRYRSAENCLAEIELLMRDYGLTNFMFWDDAISVRRKNIMEFCERATASQLNFSFATATRANLVDDELMRALKLAGCVELSLGVESGSPRISKLIQKDLDLGVLRQAVKIIEKHRVALGCFFMAGFPQETKEDLQQTFALIKELKQARCVFNIFDPMPGSGLYAECERLGLVPADADWTNFPLWPDAYYVNAMTPAEFDVLAWEMADYIFSRNDSFSGKVRRYLPMLLQNPAEFCRKLARFALRGLGLGRTMGQ